MSVTYNMDNVIAMRDEPHLDNTEYKMGAAQSIEPEVYSVSNI